MDLRLTSARSSIAVTVTSFGVRLLQIVSTILLARLLDPSDFGLIALVHILLGGLRIFTTLGLPQALIVTKEDKLTAAFHTFILTAIAGITLTFLMLAVAAPYATFYETPQLILLSQVMAPIVLFEALRIVPEALLKREMLFGRQVLPTVVASLGGIIVSLGMAIQGHGVWSLASGAVTASLLQLLGITMVCPEWGWLRKRPWNGIVAGHLMRFGFHNLSTWVVQYFYNNFDDVVVGKMLGAKQLGFYTQGFGLSNMAVTSVSSVINSVLLPAYSKIGEEKERLARAYLKSLQLVSIITIPLAMGIFIVAPEAVIVLIGEKWREAIPVLQVFAFMSLIRPLSGSTSPLFMSIGFPQYNLRTALVQAISLTLLIFPLIPWGITGVAFAVTCAFVLGFIHNLYLVTCRIDVPITMRAIMRSLQPSLLAGCLMVLAMWLMKMALAGWLGYGENAFSLINLVLTAGVSYPFFLFLIDRRLFTENVALVLSAVRWPPSST